MFLSKMREVQEPEVPVPPAFYSKPCGGFSSSALRANIARFFMRPRAARAWVTLGGAAP